MTTFSTAHVVQSNNHVPSEVEKQNNLLAIEDETNSRFIGLRISGINDFT
jgi:hypothetical protein